MHLHKDYANLYNRQGKLFGAHSRIFFLNSSEDLIFLVLGDKTTRIFCPTEDYKDH